MLKKQTGRRFYRKAPVKFLLKKSQGLKKLALVSFVLSLVFLLLSNPILSWQKIKNLPNKLSAMEDNLPKTDWSNTVEIIKDLPGNIEQTSFAVFDWVEAQLKNNWPVFAGEKTEEKIAAMIPKPTPDYADLAFYIEIPSLELYEEVSANINANDPEEYEPALESGVAHALNSAFPGQEKLIYIFGHSTNGLWNVEAYNAVFYQIKDLELGEEIILHLGDKRFVYRVTAQEVVASSEINFVNNLKDENLLLLQTCWPPGTSWQRLFVMAESLAVK